MRYHEIVRENHNYITTPQSVVYHGSKTPAIKRFEYREGTRSVLWHEVKVKSTGFFFALTAEDAALFGPYVGCYRITCRKPLVSGTEGVDSIAPEKCDDFNYIFAAMLEDDGDGTFSHEGLLRITTVRAEDLQNPQSQWFLEFIGPGGLDWECLDNPEFVRRMRERGYDGTVLYEPDTKSKRAWFVVSPEQIEYLGEYSPNDDEDEEWD